jgi:hypothetical protein
MGVVAMGAVAVGAVVVGGVGVLREAVVTVEEPTEGLRHPVTLPGRAAYESSRRVPARVTKS